MTDTIKKGTHQQSKRKPSRKKRREGEQARPDHERRLEGKYFKFNVFVAGAHMGTVEMLGQNAAEAEAAFYRQFINTGNTVRTSPVKVDDDHDADNV